MEIFNQMTDVFEMIRTGELHVLYVLVPLQIIVFAFPCLIVARSKGKNLTYARMLGLLPVINIGALVYYLFAPSQRPLFE